MSLRNSNLALTAVERAPNRGALIDGLAYAAREQVAIPALRVGFALMSIAAGTDLLFALVGGDGVTAGLEGAALTLLPLVGVARPELAAGLLLPRGRAVLLAGVFAIAGALDWGVQAHFSEVAPAIVWIAAIVSSKQWVALAVMVSGVGYLADLAVLGHSLGWMFSGAGGDVVANQLIDIAGNAGLVVALVAVLHRFLARAPDRLVGAREGTAAALTPQLSAAVRAPGQRLLGRAAAADVVAPLTAAERNVLALLAAGRAPKQAALELTVTLATVRSHIASAKRKTGARTLKQLVALFAEANDAA